MKVLLISPPVRYTIPNFPKGIQIMVQGMPLGLMYIAAFLEKNNVDVELYDAAADFEINILYNTVRNGAVFFGASWKRIRDRISRVKPDFVGITTHYSEELNIDTTLTVARLVKEVNKNIITIAGGPTASITPDIFFRESKDIDIVVMGEGEFVMLEIIKRFYKENGLRELDGIAYRENGSFMVNEKSIYIEDLDRLPFPAYHLVDLERYFEMEKMGFSMRLGFKYRGSERTVPIITSRGCPYQCIFCSNHFMGKKWRANSSEYVIRHIKLLAERYAVKHIHFEDDNLTLSLKRFEYILDSIIMDRLKITWDTPNGVRADSLDRKLIEKSRKSGCTYLMIGVESGNDYILNTIIRKQLSLKKCLMVARDCYEIGVDLGAFFMIGLPGETKQNIKKTLDFALRLNKKYNVRVHLKTAAPVAGTELYKICKQKGYLTKPLAHKNIIWTKVFVRVNPLMQRIETEDFGFYYLDRVFMAFYLRIFLQSLINAIKSAVLNPEISIRIFLGITKEIIKSPQKAKQIIRNYIMTKILFKNSLKRFLAYS